MMVPTPAWKASNGGYKLSEIWDGHYLDTCGHPQKTMLLTTLLLSRCPWLSSEDQVLMSYSIIHGLMYSRREWQFGRPSCQLNFKVFRVSIRTGPQLVTLEHLNYSSHATPEHTNYLEMVIGLYLEIRWSLVITTEETILLEAKLLVSLSGSPV